MLSVNLRVRAPRARYSILNPKSSSQEWIILVVDSDPLSERTPALACKCRCIFRRTLTAEQLGQAILHIPGTQFSAHPNRQTFAGVLVDEVHLSKWPSIIGSIHGEIIAPDVDGAFRTQADARTVISHNRPRFAHCMFSHFLYTRSASRFKSARYCSNTGPKSGSDPAIIGSIRPVYTSAMVKSVVPSGLGSIR